MSGGVAVGKAKDSTVAGKEMILYYRIETKHLYNKSNEIHRIFQKLHKLAKRYPLRYIGTKFCTGEKNICTSKIMKSVEHFFKNYISK